MPVIDTFSSDKSGRHDQPLPPPRRRRRQPFLRSMLLVGLLFAAGQNVAHAADRPTRILFVCEHGYAKSLVASRFFQRMAKARGMRVEVVARGIAPQSPVPPAIVANMAKDGFDVGSFRPQKLTIGDAAHADRVVAFGVDVIAPPGVPVENWEVPALSEDYPVARTAIVARLGALIDRLKARSR